jgi:hypothetical protein
VSESNGKYQTECFMEQHWTQINAALQRSEARKDLVDEVTRKVAKLDELPSIATEIRNLNRNNTILLVILGMLLIINAVSTASVNFKGSAFGASAEITQGNK